MCQIGERAQQISLGEPRNWRRQAAAAANPPITQAMRMCVYISMKSSSINKMNNQFRTCKLLNGFCALFAHSCISVPVHAPSKRRKRFRGQNKGAAILSNAMQLYINMILNAQRQVNFAVSQKIEAALSRDEHESAQLSRFGPCKTTAHADEDLLLELARGNSPVFLALPFLHDFVRPTFFLLSEQM